MLDDSSDRGSQGPGPAAPERGLAWRRAALIGPLALQALGLLLVAGLTLPLVSQWHARDLQLYADAGRALLQGRLPYRDFPLEYPPLALVPFALPWLLALGQPLGQAGYTALFALQSALLSTLVALTLARVAALVRPLAVAPALWQYALLTTLTAPLLPWRYDLFPALLTALALLAVLRRRPALAGIAVGLGVAAKLYPAVLLPVFGLYYLVGRERRALLWLALGCVGALGAVLLPFLLTDPSGPLSFLRYHEQRGLQLESLPAAAIVLLHALGRAPASLVFRYGALELDAPLANVALRWQPLVLLLVFGLVYALCLLRFRADHAARGAVAPLSLTLCVIAALLAFIVTNKVFSPQYVVWLLPFAPLLRPRLALLFVALCALTIVIFPFSYAALLDMRLAPALLLNLRNVLAALLLWRAMSAEQ